MATFTDDQRSRARYHTGLPDSDRIAILVNGERTVVEAQYAVNRTLDLLAESAKPKILQLLEAADGAEEKIFGLAKSRTFSQLGKMTINSNALNELEAIYDAICERLSSALGVSYTRWRNRGGGGGRSDGISGRWTR